MGYNKAMGSFAKLFCLILLGSIFAFGLDSVSMLGMGESNIAYMVDGEALLHNPSFLNKMGFSLTKQVLDMQQSSYSNYQVDLITMGSFGLGTVRYTDAQSGASWTTTLTGFGHRSNRSLKWGVTYQNIELKTSGQTYKTWSTLVGLSYQWGPPNLSFLGLSLEHFFKNDIPALPETLAPKIRLSYGFLPFHSLLWTHLLSYERKAGESIHYNTGVTFLLGDSLTLSLGLNQQGYTAGMDLPLSLGDITSLGKINYSIVMPYTLEKPLRYYVSYTYSL